MFAWIIEADIYRLEKALWLATQLDERKHLESLLHRKRLQLAAAIARPGGEQTAGSAPNPR